MMKGSILLDTNIIISREDNNEISRELQELLAILNGNEFKVLFIQCLLKTLIEIKIIQENR